MICHNFFIILLLKLYFTADAMGTSPAFITDKEIKELLNWDSLIPAVEKAMADISNNEVVQPSRLIMQLPSKNGALLAMPAFSETQEALGCKLVTSFLKNKEKGLPTIFGTILLMDSDTGRIKMIMEGTEITTWRTAAASVVATKNLHHSEKNVLAILGAGTQGRIHALAMKHFFNFTEVRIWNRSPERAKKLCEELGSWAVHYTSNEDCVKGADVIVTATYSKTPIVMLPWVKDGAHINAIGAGITHHSELDEKIYSDNKTSVFVDHMGSAVKELKGLIDIGVELVAEVGQVINDNAKIPPQTKITVFQSLGMAIEDVMAAKLVYESYLTKQNKTIIEQNTTAL